ncbi:glycoside hydrolase family 2 TIM barrel-domain containing protein [Candidatus Poribacteria bacterium]
MVTAFSGISLFFLLLVASTADADVVIEKLMPFAGADNVLIDVSIASDDKLSGVGITGQIVPCAGGAPLWEGVFAKPDIEVDAANVDSYNITDLRPALWSPASPTLYNLTLKVARDGYVLATRTVRFGFRSLSTRNGQFLLNGKPLFLRGNSINPPGRGILPEVGETREFAESYLRYMKSRNVNLVRTGSKHWLDVCDELGIMVFLGRYGAPRGGSRSEPPDDFDRCISSYKEILEPLVSHPSVVIYVLTNEIGFKGEKGKIYIDFMRRVHKTLKEWDPNRLHIGNAGFGGGRTGDMRDMHPYWGWYSGSFLSYFRLRSNESPGLGDKQPWTFSECVGCYTGQDGKFTIKGKLLAAQEMWTGHAEDQSEAALSYQAFMVSQAVETIRRLRPINPRLAGIMPFTSMFFNWYGVSRFEDMKPKPAMEQLGVSMQPVLLSWEMWTPQIYAGSEIQAIAHIVNDSDDYSALKDALLLYRVESEDSQMVIEDKIALPSVPYYQVRSVLVTLELPKTMNTGNYRLSGEVIKGGSKVSHNAVDLFIADPNWAIPQQEIERQVALYDPAGKTARALRRIGIAFKQVDDMAEAKVETPLIIGEEAWDERLSASADRFRELVDSGGRILCLRQAGGKFDTSWLPGEIELANTSGKPYRNGMNINMERPWHPVFDGISRERLTLWSDYSGWDQTKDGYPESFPVTLGFRVDDQQELSRTAVLANYDRGLVSIALCEIFGNKGSVILSGFDLVNRSGIDPVADRLLANLVVYTASSEVHNAHPLINSPIIWGNYPTERGVITGVKNGLIVNASMVYPNSYEPQGRRPFGPFKYNGLCHIVDLNPDSKTGSGLFWARVPKGTTEVITKVENPTEESAELDIEVNGKNSAGTDVIPSGKTISLRRGISPDTTEVSIKYTGHKGLVILETAFQ